MSKVSLHTEMRLYLNVGKCSTLDRVTNELIWTVSVEVTLTLYPLGKWQE